ncbi:hypothetical protein LPJ66_002955 [Kickxella alabastrina]|uniref:Uncharacterized protein n=1 Tax=Kickxella alabastrina TaxID=61397 RepID=A0ACC1INZ7_9FUNG|nr:hypothetical protein LPJ66_002955 [Kickxella alabastrina]
MVNIKFKSDGAEINEKRRHSAVINMASAGAGQASSSDGDGDGDGDGDSEHHNNNQRRSVHNNNNSTLSMPSVDLPSTLQDDFNWDNVSENSLEIDPKDEGARTLKGFWRLHPLIRAFIIMIGGGIILIIPVVSVLASHRDLPFRGSLEKESDNFQTNYNLQCVARSFALMTAVWILGVLIYHLIDMIPDGALRVVRTFHGKRNIEKLKDRMQFFVAVKLYIKMILISATSLVAFVVMFPNASYRFVGKVENGSSSWDQVLFQINVLVLFACTIIGVEKLVLKVIATRFHKSAYKERIQQQAYASWVLDHLNQARESNATGSAGNNTPYMGSNISTFDSGNLDPMSSRKELLHQHQYASQPSTNETYLPKSARHLPGSATPPPFRTSESGRSSFWRRNTFSNSPRPKHHKLPSKGIATRLWNIKDRALDGGVGMNSSQYAARLARKLFGALHKDRNYLLVDDFLPFFDKEEDAIKAFELFDKDNNGDISKREMRDRVMLIYKERRSLLSALSDMSQVVGKLDLFLTVFALLIILVIALLVFGLDALKSLATMGTLFIGWSFVFGNTFKTIFECLVFLFQVHSYDVGDIVVIATENLTVSKIRLLSTVFFKTDGTYTVYPNNILATMKIQNLRRSNPQSESILIGVDFNTPSEKLYDLRDRMNNYVEENPRDLVGPIGFNIDLLENSNRILISLGISHRSNWQDGGKRALVKTQFSFALRHHINELGLKYALPLQPVTMVPPPPEYDEMTSPVDKPASRGSRPRSSGGSDEDDDLFNGMYHGANSRSHRPSTHHHSAGDYSGGGHGRSGGNNDSAGGVAMPAAAMAAATAGMAISDDF